MDDHSSNIMKSQAIVITDDRGRPKGGTSIELEDSLANEHDFGRTFLMKITKAMPPQRTAKIRPVPEDLSGNMTVLMASAPRWSSMPSNSHVDDWPGEQHEFDMDLSPLATNPSAATFVCIYLSDPAYYFNPDRKVAVTAADEAGYARMCNPRLYAVGDTTPKYVTFKVEPGVGYCSFNLSFVRVSDSHVEYIDPKIKNTG